MENNNDKLIWITMINYGYINYTKNFLKSMEIANVNFKLIIYCIDYEKIIEELKDFSDRNYVCIDANIFLKKSFNVSSGFKTWADIEYKKIVFCKLDAIKYTLINNKDYNLVGYIDTDIIVLSDPTKVILEYANKNQNIIVFGQCDEVVRCSNIFNCSNLCSGVIVFRNVNNIELLFEYSIEDIPKYGGDQDFLISKYRQYNIKFMTIEKNIFLNGTFPGIKSNNQVQLPSSASLVHFNWMIGIQKEKYMKIQKLWFI